MTSELYNVVVSGHVRNGFDRSVVFDALRKALNKPGSQIVRLLNGEEHAVRRKVTEQKARAYHRYLYALGVEVKLTKVVDQVTPEAVEHMHTEPKSLSVSADNKVAVIGRAVANDPEPALAKPAVEPAAETTPKFLRGLYKESAGRLNLPYSIKAKIISAFAPMGLASGFYLALPVVLGVTLVLHVLFNAVNLVAYPTLWYWCSYFLPAILGGPFILFLLKPVLAKKTHVEHSMRVSETEEPKLWQLVHSVAGQLDIPAPQNIKFVVEQSNGVQPAGDSLKDCLNEPSLVLGLSDLRVLPESAFVGHIAQQLGFCHRPWLLKLRLFTCWLDTAIAQYLAQEDSWDAFVADKIESIEEDSFKKLFWLEVKRNFDFQRTIISKFQDALGRRVNSLNELYKLSGGINAVSLLGSRDAEALLNCEERLNKSVVSALRLNARDREDFVLAENIPLLVAWLSKQEGLINRYLDKSEQLEDSAIHNRIEQVRHYARESSMTRRICTSDVLRRAELLEEKLTIEYYKTKYSFPLEYRLADAESILESLTNKAAEERNSSAYFSNWKFQLGQWVLPDINKVPEKTEVACVKALNSVIERLRSITPDRNKLCDDAKLQLSEVCHLNVARIAESFGDVYHIKGVSHSYKSVGEALKTKTSKYEKTKENLLAFEEIMGLRVVLGVRLAQIKRKGEVVDLYQSLHRLSRCQNLLWEYERHLQSVTFLREQKHSKQRKRYQPWVVKSERCLEELIQLTLKHTTQIPYFWGQKHDFLAEYIRACLSPIEPSNAQNKQRRALIAHRIINEANEQLSRRIGNLLGKLEKEAGVNPLRIEFKVNRTMKEASNLH